MELAVPFVKHLFVDREDVVRLKVFQFHTRTLNEYREQGDVRRIKEDRLTSFVCSFGNTLKFQNAIPDFV